VLLDGLPGILSRIRDARGLMTLGAVGGSQLVAGADASRLCARLRRQVKDGAREGCRLLMRVSDSAPVLFREAVSGCWCC
jgi:hypothetical protein